MPRFSNLNKCLMALAVFGFLALAQGTVQADPISVCTGAGCSTTNVSGSITAGNGTVTITLNNDLTNAQGTVQADPISVCTGAGCSTTNVTGTITAGNGTVTITLDNNLTNAQVISVIQNISGVYFQVSGYNGGAVTLASSNSTNSTNVSGGVGTLAGAVNPTGWGAGASGNTVTVCVICAFGITSPAGPDQTIIGGTGSGFYANANGSINGNAPHNPFLTGTVTFVLNVPGVTVNSTFSNVVIQFGTTATPPNGEVPEPASMLLLGTGLIGIAAGARRRFGKKK